MHKKATKNKTHCCVLFSDGGYKITPMKTMARERHQAKAGYKFSYSAPNIINIFARGRAVTSRIEKITATWRSNFNPPCIIM
jgi:hypothetical protein